MDALCYIGGKSVIHPVSSHCSGNDGYIKECLASVVSETQGNFEIAFWKSLRGLKQFFWEKKNMENFLTLEDKLDFEKQLKVILSHVANDQDEYTIFECCFLGKQNNGNMMPTALATALHFC